MKNWLTKNRRVIGMLGATVFTMFLVFVPQSAHAEWWKIELAETFLKSFINPVGDLFLMVAGWLLSAAGYVLNLIVNETIINFKANLPTGVNVGWTLFRDIANMFFIFILLYIAIGTILNLSSVQTKKMLVHVIIVALLLNFSLFFTKVIIDVSNVITIGFYKSVISLPTDSSGSSSNNITGQIMAKLGISTIYSPKNYLDNLTDEEANAEKSLGIEFVTKFGGVLFTIILTFVLVVIAVLLLLRFITLLFLMVLSPLAYVAYIIPTMQQHSSKWWKKLIDNCIFPPAFMALLWVSIQMIPNFNNGNTYSGIGNLNEGTVKIILNFFMAIAFLIGTVIISKEIGVAGAGAMASWGKKLRQGATGFVGRNTIGRAGYAIDKKLEGTAIGQWAPVRGLRNITTGAAAGGKFGSKDSYKSSVKETEELNKKYAEGQKKKTEKDFDKSLPEIRKDNLEAHLDIAHAHKQKVADAEAKLAQNQYLPTMNQAEENALKAEISNLKSQEAEMQKTEASMRANIANESLGTAEEISTYLKPKLKEREDALAKPGLVSRTLSKSKLTGWIPKTFEVGQKVNFLKKGARQTTAEYFRDQRRGKKTSAEEVLAQFEEFQKAQAGGGTPTTPPAAPTTPPPSTPKP